MSNASWQKLLEQALSSSGAERKPAGRPASGVLDKVLGSGLGAGLLGGVIGGLLTGKSGRKLAGSAVKVGGIAAVGALAYTAYQRYKQGGLGTTGVTSETAVEAQDQGFLSATGDVGATSALGVALVRAMIAAAKADGRIDDTERTRILAQISEQELSAEEKAFLLDEFAQPLDIDSIVALGVSTEVSIELYAASLLAIEVDTPAEQAYLQMLAARLGLDKALVSELHSTILGSAR